MLDRQLTVNNFACVKEDGLRCRKWLKSVEFKKKSIDSQANAEPYAIASVYVSLFLAEKQTQHPHSNSRCSQAIGWQLPHSHSSIKQTHPFRATTFLQPPSSGCYGIQWTHFVTWQNSVAYISGVANVQHWLARLTGKLATGPPNGEPAQAQLIQLHNLAIPDSEKDAGTWRKRNRNRTTTALVAGTARRLTIAFGIKNASGKIKRKKFKKKITEYNQLR